MSKKRNAQQLRKRIMSGISLAVLLIAISLTAWYLWGIERRPSPLGKNSVGFRSIEPKKYCAPKGGICLTIPSDWRNTTYPVEATHMRLVPSSNDKSQINYQYESPTKTQACKPGACLLTVISLENIAPLPTTVVVRGVFQRPDLNLNVPQEFLLSATDVQKYGLAAGKTSDIGVEATPKFSRTVGGVTYTQALEVGGSNYDNLANAKKWFDTPEAKAAHAIITTLSTAPDS